MIYNIYKKKDKINRMQQFKKEDNHYSRFVDAVQIYNIEYIESDECKKYFINNWWEKYDGLAIKIVIKNKNVKLFNRIPVKILKSNIMISLISEYAGNIIFNKYYRHASTINICKIYYNNMATNEIKYLCNRVERENIIKYKIDIDEKINKFEEKICNYSEKEKIYNVFIFNHINHKYSKKFTGTYYKCKNYLKNFKQELNNIITHGNIISSKGKSKYIDTDKIKYNVNIYSFTYIDCENESEIYNILLYVNGNEYLTLYRLDIIEINKDEVRNKLKLLDFITMKNKISNKLTNINNINKKVKEQMKQ